MHSSAQRIACVLGCLAAASVQADSYLVIANGHLSKGIDRNIMSAGGEIVTKIPQIGIVVAESDNPDFASNVRGVRSVVRDMHVAGPETMDVELDSIPQPPFTGDDDFLFDLQWGHTSVRAQEAWAAGLTGAGVRVFVLDGGFDLDHPDLAPNINLGLSTSFGTKGTNHGFHPSERLPWVRTFEETAMFGERLRH